MNFDDISIGSSYKQSVVQVSIDLQWTIWIITLHQKVKFELKKYCHPSL
jgi:hypothetical protein